MPARRTTGRTQRMQWNGDCSRSAGRTKQDLAEPATGPYPGVQRLTRFIRQASKPFIGELGVTMETLFWDVDTQFDFVMPTGKLYVPGAEEIIETVSGVRRLALDNGFSIMADIDWHRADDPEISETPDFKETFPPHCMADQPGSERVGYLGDVPIDYVEIGEASAVELQALVRKEPFHIVIKKNSLDVFENPNTHTLVDLLRPKQIIVFGVALDFCVTCVLHGLAKYDGIQLVLLKDATKGLGARPEEEIYAEFSQMGVQVTTLDKLKGRLSCG
jgi:nicotinamidase/pyrazinamidase